MGAILTYLSTERTRNIAREELKHTEREAERNHKREVESGLNDRFVTAVEQLGNKEQHPVKLGGVYSLLALAEDWVAFGNQAESFKERARKQAQVCVDVLCSYVKSNAHMDRYPDVAIPESELRSVIFKLLVGTRRSANGTGRTHPLSWTRLNFDGADLTGLRLGAIDGDEMSFKGTNLSGTDLADSRWTFGEFQRTILLGADLTNVHFNGACMEGTNFEGAQLNGTDLEGVHLHDAHLIGADFSLARGLAVEQVTTACCWDETTEWPAGFKPLTPVRYHPEPGWDSQSPGFRAAGGTEDRLLNPTPPGGRATATKPDHPLHDRPKG